MSAMTLIEHIEVGAGGETSVAFDSIAADYDDLMIQVSATDDGRTGNVASWYLEVNDLQTGIYSSKVLRTYNTSVLNGGTTNETGLWLGQIGISLAVGGSWLIYIPNYASSNGKTLSLDGVTEKNASEVAQTLLAGFINTTAAITKVRLYPADSPATSNGSFAEYSSFTLYGITAGSDGSTTVS